MERLPCCSWLSSSSSHTQGLPRALESRECLLSLGTAVNVSVGDQTSCSLLFCTSAQQFGHPCPTGAPAAPACLQLLQCTPCHRVHPLQGGRGGCWGHPHPRALPGVHRGVAEAGEHSTGRLAQQPCSARHLFISLAPLAPFRPSAQINGSTNQLGRRY